MSYNAKLFETLTANVGVANGNIVSIGASAGPANLVWSTDGGGSIGVGTETSGPGRRPKAIFAVNSVIIGTPGGTVPYGQNNSLVTGVLLAGNLANSQLLEGSNSFWNGEALGFTGFVKDPTGNVCTAFVNTNGPTDTAISYSIVHRSAARQDYVSFSTAGLTLLNGTAAIFNGTTSGSVTVTASAITSSYALTWPAAQGPAGATLTNDGSGGVTWVIPANTYLSNLTSPTAVNQDLLFGTDGSKTIGALGASRPKAVTVSSFVNIGNAPQNSDQSASYYDGFLQVGSSPGSALPTTVFRAGAVALTDLGNAQFGFFTEHSDLSHKFEYFQRMLPSDTGYVSEGDVSWNNGIGISLILPDTGGLIANGPLKTNSLVLNGAVSGAVTINATATTTPYSVLLPAAQGGAGTILTNDGSGNFSWALGASGNVSGPASSVTNMVATYANTSGLLLADPSTTLQVLVPAGDGLDSIGGLLNGNLAVAFSGPIMYSPGTTGFKIVPTVSGSRDWLCVYVQDRQVISINSQTNPSTPKVDIALIGFGGGVRNWLRTDGGLWDLGTNTGAGHGSFQQVWADSFIAGNTTPGRYIYFTALYSGGGVPGVNPWGIGLDSSGGKEFFLGLSPDNGVHYPECFNVICATTTSTIVSAPDNAIADATSAFSLTIKGANKTAGTGNGGSLILDVGTSAGGSPGQINLPSMAASSVLRTDASKNLTTGGISVSDLTATGTPSSTTFLAGDNTWQTISGGGIVGPSPSTQYGAAIYANTSGNLLLDSVLSGHGILVGAGLNQDLITGIALGDLGISFAGSAPDEVSPHTVIPLYSPGLTGWKVNPNSGFGIDYLSQYISGIMISQTSLSGVTPRITFENGTNLRPDTINNTSNFGGNNNSFNQSYFNTYFFGGTSNSPGTGARFKFMIDTQNVPNGSPGIGHDTNQGAEWYFASMDPANGYVTKENFNIVFNNNITTLSAPANAVANASAAITITVKGADKTAGTGDGGNLILSGGTSVGGTPGTVQFPNGFSVRSSTSSTASTGSGTLSSGTVTITTTAALTTSNIFLQDTGGGVLANVGTLQITTKSNGSFVVTSTNALDTSTFDWLVVNTF